MLLRVSHWLCGNVGYVFGLSFRRFDDDGCGEGREVIEVVRLDGFCDGVSSFGGLFCSGGVRLRYFDGSLVTVVPVWKNPARYEALKKQEKQTCAMSKRTLKTQFLSRSCSILIQ